MWKIITLFVCIFCTNFTQGTYNAGIKTRVYEHQPITHVYHNHQHQQAYTPIHEHYHHHGSGNNDRDYQASITHQHVHNDNPYQQPQNEGSYNQQSSTPVRQRQQHNYQQQLPEPQIQPIYERKGNSEEQKTIGNWQNSENSITEYYAGCPAGHTGQLPYAYDCRRFLNCWHGRGHIQTCSVGTVFNPETLECDRPDKVKCETALGILGVQSVVKAPSPSQGNLKQPNYRAGRYTDSTNDNVEVLCPAGAEGLQPHPSDCTRFINCANGNMHIQQCGPGTAYSIPMQVCDFRNKVDCSGREGEVVGWDATSRHDTQTKPTLTTPTNNQHEDLPHTADILCLNGITGLFPYPFDYTKFINCKNGNTAIQNCVPGTAFSISKGYCESLDDILQSDHVMYIVSEVSYEYSQTLITCPPGTEGLHLYPFNAELFVKCVKSQMKIVPCSSSQVFSIPRRTCLPHAQVLKNERVRLLNELQSTISYRPVEERYRMRNLVYCPAGLTGMYPHPFDSTKYLKCERGRLFSESCASGEAFSLSRKVCSLKEELNVDDHVPQAIVKHGQEWTVTDMEITHGSIDGLTYLMCPPGVVGYFLHPFDCTKYIECSRGATAVDNCLNGAVFSISRKECIPRDKVDAYDRVEYMTTTKNEFSNEPVVGHELGVSCSAGIFGIYPHPQDHHKYVRCANGHISVEDCPAGQVFSVTKSFCHNAYEIDSNDRSSYNRGYSSTQDHYTGPVTATTNTVHQSASFEPIKPSFSTGISPPSVVLNPPPLPAASSSSTVGDVNCPPGVSGRYPHPFDCTKFLMCSNGETHIQDCGPGTAWNKAMEVCDFKDKVDCSQNEVSSTATIITNLNPQSRIKCPAGVEGLYQHPFDWHKYLVCNHGQTMVLDCAHGTVFSLSRKICDVEANVLNTDRCNNGVYSSDNDYSQNSKTYGTSPVNTQVTGNRWTNMNVPRPQSSQYDHSTTWQHTSHQPKAPSSPDVTSTWTGTAVHVDQHNPTHTVIFEEGSFQPNRNYNRQMFTTPLAPFNPPNTSSSTSTVVYAQPLGSQEDSREIFGNTPTKPLHSPNLQQTPILNRENHTRHLYTWTPIRPVDIPRHFLMPPRGQGQGTVYTNTHVQIPITNHLMPPYQLTQLSPGQPEIQIPALNLMPPYNDGDSGQKTLPDTDFKLTTINIDQLPGQTSYNLNDFDQLPSASLNHDINDASNLYGGLQPPFTDSQTTTSASNFLDQYPETTQVPVPPKTTTPTKRITGYPQLSNATIQTFPHQPHYSPPYSEVAHSRNSSWAVRKTPEYAAIKPIYRDSLNRDNTNLKFTSTPPPPNYGPNSPSYANGESEENYSYAEPHDQKVAMQAALKLLLKPYVDKKISEDDDVALKAQSHIMSLVSTTTAAPPTHHQPLPSNKNTIVATTTPHQLDVELILAGEQNSLIGVTTKRTVSHENPTTYNLHQTPVQPERSSALPSTNIHDHKSNWRRHHPHDRHHSKLHHSRDFHEKHPNLPNPFADTTPNTVSSYNPRAEATTQRNYDFDLRIGGRCAFECGNGKCIEQHQVCDGVNNCENHKDEEQCEHLGYELRLTGGQSSNMGRVEVKILGKWGYVCDDKFGLRDADVVCRELGFKMGAMEVRGNSYYAPSDVNMYFAMDEVECKGNETSLRECDFKGWGVNNCGPDEVVGVVCKVPKLKCPDNYWLCSTSKECIPTAFLCDVTPDCEDGSDESEQVCNAPIKYRLEGGRSSNEGRLEVFYRGEWGTVCDDDFGVKEAQVVCNSFGLYGKPEIAKNIYGPGSGPIWLDQVSCLGNESKIDECNHWSWGENNCNHTEDVGLKCTAGPKPNSLKGKNPSRDEDVEPTLEFGQSELDDLGLYQGLWQRSSKAVRSQKKCGHFKTNLVDEYEHPEERVVNGSIAKRGRHPWQATVRTRGRGGISSHWCGAVIISKKLILTAAHCLAGYPKGSYFVRMGDHYANIAESSEIDSNIENWYIHEKFRDQKHMNNDIALILLKTPVRFNDYVQPICLPEKGATLEPNRMCTISGWGSIKSGTSTPSNILRSAQVPILTDEICSQKNVYANAMTEGMFCAGFLDESADACDGDSGGPLVCSDEDGETLYGIISWGQHCGYANHPGVYVRVEKYIDWIYDKINLMIKQGKL